MKKDIFNISVKLKPNKGITIISLVLAVMVMAILSGTVIFNGSKAIQTSKKQKFVSELEMVQSKVNTISEKMQDSQTEKEYYNSAGKNIETLDQERLKVIIGKAPKNGSSYTSKDDGYLYFETSDLDKIGISGITQNILINFETREIYSYTGLEQGGKMYYSLQGLGNSAWNVQKQ